LLGIYGYALQHYPNTGEARALAFTAMVIGNIGLIFIHRSVSSDIMHNLRLPNPALWWVVATASVILLLALSIPAISALFHFGQPALSEVLISARSGSVLHLLDCRRQSIPLSPAPSLLSEVDEDQPAKAFSSKPCSSVNEGSPT
jgi:Ca2+-transporting ATPase